MPVDPERCVRVRVPAKVNLMLGVGDLRPDGYHELRTVFHAVGLFDEVAASAAPALSLTVEGEGAGALPTDAGNLAWQAAELLAETAGVPARAHLTVRKSIPVAGGLAGGSADAAATLVACAELWNLGLDRSELALLGARLGSDVAFPLLGGTALGTGRGEILEPTPAAVELRWVLAVSDFGISARDAYRELDRQRDSGTAAAPAGDPEPLLHALAHGDITQVAALLANDLQPAALALAPRLHDVLAAGLAGGALAGIVSGSGPTCAFLCLDGQAADGVVAALEAAGVARAVRASGHTHPAVVLP